MTRRIPRRDFLGYTLVSAATTLACSSGDKSKRAADGGRSNDAGISTDPADTDRVFPQGVASGDPKPGSVILWTRLEPGDGEDTTVTYEVATDDAFTDVVASGDAKAEASADYTVRLKVVDLSPKTTYYYRFVALGVQSTVGRTKTAPATDDPAAVRFALASCQDFVGRYHHAWRALVELEDDVDIVIHLGDYIYETDGDPSFMTPSDDRKITLPDGLDIGSGTKAAHTLEDYRALYKQYRSDPHLKRAHALYPFITIWDDHEFANDCWQDHATDFNEAQGDEKSPDRREAADRAWFEYQPVEVEYDENAAYPDDIRIYRKLRYGQHIELFMTDERFYRSDHVIPEGPADLSVGKFAENTEVGSRIFLLKSGFDPKEEAAAPTMLGSDQKAWLLDAVKSSDATWKLWGSEVQAAQMVVDLSEFMTLPEPFRDRFYISVDQWDGYRSERGEILSELSSVDNLVVLAGDIHAFYASELYADFDAPSETPAAVEFVCAGISSQAVAPGAHSVIAADPTLSGLGLLELIDRWDELLEQGSPHYRYANSSANGIAVASVTADALEVTFVIVGDVTEPDFNESDIEHVRMRVQSGSRRIELL